MSSQNIREAEEIRTTRESKGAGANQAKSVETFIYDVSHPKPEEYPAETFTFDDRVFRFCHDKEGKEWFCAADICHYLGHNDVQMQLVKYGVADHKRLFSLSGQKLPCVSMPDLKEILEKSRTPQAAKLLISIYDHKLPISFDHSRLSQANGATSTEIKQTQKSLEPNRWPMAHLNLGVPVVEETGEDMFEEAKPSPLSVDSLAPKEKNIGGSPVWAVNARDLYKFLNPDKPFDKWIKSLIKAYGFIEDKDFIGSVEGWNLYLSLPMAREISMTGPMQQGRKARFYFVDFANKHREEQVGGKADTSLSSPETISASETEPVEEQAWTELEERVQEEQMEEAPAEEEQIEEEFSEEEQPEASEEEPINEDINEEEFEEYFDFVEAARLLGVGVQFLRRYLDDIGWLVHQTDEPEIWIVQHGWMAYDQDRSDESGTPGFITSEGLDELEDMLTKLGVITPISD